MKNIFTQIIIAIIILSIAGFLILVPYFENTSIQEKISILKRNSKAKNISESFKSNEFNLLPFNVKNYLYRSIQNRTFSPKTSKLVLSGKTRTTQNSEWTDVNSTIYFSTSSPTFIEIAETITDYFVWDQTKNIYQNGIASTETKFLSSIPLSSFSGNKLSRSYLVLYLMEAVFSPTILLPNNHVKWKPINSTSARATIWKDNLDGAATFYFNSNNDVIKIVSGDRFMPGKVDYTKEIFTIHFANYKDVGNYYIPTYFELQWNLAGNDFTFGRFQIKDISYE